MSDMLKCHCLALCFICCVLGNIQIYTYTLRSTCTRQSWESLLSAIRIVHLKRHHAVPNRRQNQRPRKCHNHMNRRENPNPSCSPKCLAYLKQSCEI